MTTMQSLPVPSPGFDRVADFIDGAVVPPEVMDFAALLVLDLIGVAAAGAGLPASRIARNHAARHWAAGPGAPSARLLFDGRSSSLPGAAFALAAALDNLDAHDGWQPSKGHAGAALFPALVALAEAQPALSGREALTALVIGYETAYRAAAALHATTADYHTSGAWNALGCVAIFARLRRLGRGRLREAMGIAEFHAPRSQMMREIANPSMLHDGTAWGAPTGLASALLAEEGFTGAPAALIEFDDAAFAWADLGTDWLTTAQYIKNYPVCRWAHAPIDAALALRAEHGLTEADIAAVEIDTFAYSAALFQGIPASSPVAQYSLAWPVAAALARGRVGVAEVIEASFADPAIGRLTRATTVRVDPVAETAYPTQRLGRVALVLADGRRLAAPLRSASGGPEPPPRAAEIVAKFRAFATPALGAERTAAIESAALGLTEESSNFKTLLSHLWTPTHDMSASG
jgi:2-methylcitrate dehydratase PrpD